MKERKLVPLYERSVVCTRHRTAGVGKRVSRECELISLQTVRYRD